MNRKLKILYIIGELGHGKAGTEGHLITTIRALDRNLFEPCLISLKPVNRELRETLDCPVVTLKIKSFYDPAFLMKIMWLARFIRRNRFDVLKGFFVEANFVGLLAAHMARLPNTISCRRNLGYSYTPRQLALLRSVNPFVRSFLVNSRAVRDAVATLEGIDPARVHIVYNGVDLNYFRGVTRTRQAEIRAALRLEEPTIKVAVLANLRPVKNLEMFLRAAFLLSRRRRDLTFVLLGDGPSEPQLRRLTQALQIEPMVRFAGSCDDVAGYLSVCDIGVLPSDSEGFSNSILEYMAARLPVVATDVGGNREAVIEGETGYLTAPGDPLELADRVLRLVENRALAVRLGETGFKVVQEQFSLDKMMEATCRHYYDLVFGDGRKAPRAAH